jgi:hypothetical protein
MNAIVQFRKCTLTNEELCAKVDKLTDNLYMDGEICLRHIPARPNDDYDLLIGELILRFYETFKNKTVEVVCMCKGETQVSRINGKFLCCECQKPLL